jgi:hypothetical protein
VNAAVIFRSARTGERAKAAADWLRLLPPGAEALVIAPAWDAADDLLRGFANERGAAFAIHRLTIDKTISLLAAATLAERELAPAAGLTVIAIAARALHILAQTNKLEHFASIADRHGFASAAARTITELRLAGTSFEQLRSIESAGRPLASLLEQYEYELEVAKLADRAAMIAMASAAIGASPAPRYVGLPTLFFDVPIRSRAEADFIDVLAGHARVAMFTCAAGDVRTESHLQSSFGCQITPAQIADQESSLIRLQDYLFETKTPSERRRDESVKIFSAPGEARECVEIAREIHSRADGGVPFDRMAILLRTPTPYNAHLEETLARAGVPAYFARGTLRPEPGGRALLTLLNCAAEGLSARRFAEYLSLAQVPDPERELHPGMSFVPEDDLMPLSESSAGNSPPAAERALSIDDPVPVVEGSARAPWRWEELIVEASVIGGCDRWRRRLDGLEEEFRIKLMELEDDAAGYLERRLLDLRHLKQIALPIIDALDTLPHEANWGEWLERLTALTELAIRDREPVLTALAELEPMTPIGPLGLDEVRLVLSERLGTLTRQPPRRRYGSVYVGQAEEARGLTFDVVFVPGLAERLFPQKLIQDPILPDRLRAALGRDLVQQDDRRIAERLALKLAVGAAEKAVVLSYPRLDIDLGRPRVPSFYALEAMRAAEGHLPGFEELGLEASTVRELRLGWPAPSKPTEAIDNAEFDLALLDGLIDEAPERTVGTANYLLTSKYSNPHLTRTLRARWRKWHKGWSPYDGLVSPNDEFLRRETDYPAAVAKAAVLKHALTARSYSATALQKFAECPYRFALYTIMKLEPREEIEPVEAIDPLVRGRIFHEVQFEVLSGLREQDALPVTDRNLEAALRLVVDQLGRIAQKYREKLAPAIDRVWDDGIASISADLAEWLRRAAEKHDQWDPYRFELAFGLRDQDQADPGSCEQPIVIAGELKLRGSIDLVERDPTLGHLRITDHKTGRARAPAKVVIGGGRVLQPVLYSLAAESILSEPVDSGRLYYCTLAGGFEQREVELNDAARQSANTVIKIVGDALQTGFLPAAPDDRECQWCDYRMLCGPNEQLRSSKKREDRLVALRQLRVLP